MTLLLMAVDVKHPVQGHPKAKDESLILFQGLDNAS